MQAQPDVACRRFSSAWFVDRLSIVGLACVNPLGVCSGFATQSYRIREEFYVRRTEAPFNHPMRTSVGQS